MVRIAASVSLILSGCFAEDVYYHTQLLQTKMNSNKVSIDTAGNVEEETTLFQKAMRQTSSRKDAEARLLKRLSNAFKVTGPEMGENSVGNIPEMGENSVGNIPEKGDDKEKGEDKETEEGCMLMYGPNVDMGQCFGCKEKIETEIREEMMKNPDQMKEMEAMMEDPDGAEKIADAMIRKVLAKADDCMGQPNQVVPTCEAHYGPDVSLMKCLGCGEFCECDMEGCAKDEGLEEGKPSCHETCMTGMEGKPGGPEEGEPEGPEDGECDEMCKMFFGPEATSGQCKKCEGESFDAVKKAMEELISTVDWNDPSTMPKEEDKQRVIMGAFKSSFDTCMAPLTNLVDQGCKMGYGEDVDLDACYMCGMKCGCDPEGNCAFCKHDECMKEGKEEKKMKEGKEEKKRDEPPRGDKKGGEGKPLREPKKGGEGKPPRGLKEPQRSKGAKLVAYVQKRAKMEVEKILNDATDLMQTRQQLKK